MLWALALLGLLPGMFSFGEDDLDEGDVSADDAAPDTAGDPMPFSRDMITDAFVATDPVEIDDLLDETVMDFADSDPDTLLTGTELGDDFLVAAGSGHTTLADFEAGDDHLTLSLDAQETGIFSVTPLINETGEPMGTTLAFDSENSAFSVSFIGHDALPEDDITLSVVDPQSGDETLYSLAEYADELTITPNDPDAPSERGPMGNFTDTLLSTNDVEAATNPGPIGEVTDMPLSPEVDDDPVVGAATGATVTHQLGEDGETLVLANDPFQGGTDATVTQSGDEFTITTEGTLNQVTGGAGNDTIATGDDAAHVDAGAGNDVIYGGDGSAILAGGAGNDTLHAGHDTGSTYVLDGGEGADQLIGGAADDVLLMDDDDTATGGDGSDDFWIKIDNADPTSRASITDFQPGEDNLRLTVDDGQAADYPLDVSVAQSEDGLSTLVSINGEVVAFLQGAPDVGVSDVIVERATA
ncbi:hypothetical protein [Celeribacter arenosi]|uniref:Hemolysin-type calcium-binding repeat-containing protein n=1 Tax=Celeribacter arenosi TaxID=792649 RepID=A0ABP7JY66_9RHOB